MQHPLLCIDLNRVGWPSVAFHKSKNIHVFIKLTLNIARIRNWKEERTRKEACPCNGFSRRILVKWRKGMCSRPRRIRIWFSVNSFTLRYWELCRSWWHRDILWVLFKWRGFWVASIRLVWGRLHKGGNWTVWLSVCRLSLSLSLYLSISCFSSKISFLLSFSLSLPNYAFCLTSPFSELSQFFSPSRWIHGVLWPPVATLGTAAFQTINCHRNLQLIDS